MSIPRRALPKNHSVFVVVGILICCCMSIIDTNVLAQSPAFNFSNLGSNPNPSMDLSKLLSAIKRISGPYTNPDFGFTIVFPPGWNGSDISFGSAHIVTVSSPNAPDNTLRPSTMGVIFVDNRHGQALSSLANASDVIMDSSSSSGLGDSSQRPQCKLTSVSQVKVNGINAEERTFTCTNLENPGGNSNIKVYALVTKDDSLLTISFISPQATYDKDLPLFEQAVKTISLASPGDVSNSASYNAYKNSLDKVMK
jgi:hypothetical protein